MNEVISPGDTYPRCDFMGEAARKKLKVGPDWRAYCYEVIGDVGDILVEGSVPTGFYKTGPRKGHPKWNRDDGKKVVITQDEIQNAKDEYEESTGLCATCSGNTTECIGWSRDAGTKHMKCRKCNGTGKAPLTPEKASGEG